jgi:hypothetical protein
VEQPALFLELANTYHAKELGVLYRDLLSEGIIGPGDLAVSQRAAGANMSVDVADGATWVLGDDDPARQPLYRCRNDAVVNLAIAAADATKPRVDRIVAHVYDAQFAGAQNKWALEVLQGVATAGATDVNLLGADAIGNNELELARVVVPAAAASIVNANIVDYRSGARIGAGNLSGSGLTKLWDSVEAGVTLPTASISTPTLPQTFKHLVVEFTGRDSLAANTARLAMRMNGDATAGSYAVEGVEDSSSALSRYQLQSSAMQALGYPAATGGASTAGGGTIKIFDYARSTFLKVATIHGGGLFLNTSGSCIVGIYSGFWDSPAAVTTLTFLAASTFVAGTRITVYGEP